MSDSEDDDFLSSKVSKKASSSKITVPDGHCLVNTKWKNTEVGQSLSKLFTVKSVGDLGVADIQPKSEVIFIVLTEGDIANGKNCLDEKIKEVENFKENNAVQVYYLYHLTELTDQFLLGVQERVMFENGDQLVPLTSLDEVAQFVQQFQSTQSKSNPCAQEEEVKMSSRNILELVCEIPGLGDKRALQLLSHPQFNSLKKISQAKYSELKPVIGDGCAKRVEEFFTKRNTF